MEEPTRNDAVKNTSKKFQLKKIQRVCYPKLNDQLFTVALKG